MRPTVPIDNHTIGEGQPVFVIAELGINHNGRIEKAIELADEAKAAGANSVKIQFRTVPTLYKKTYTTPRTEPRWVLEHAHHRGVIPPDEYETFCVQSGFCRQMDRFEDADLDTPLANEKITMPTGFQKWALELTPGEVDQFDAHCKQIGMLWSASPWDLGAADRLAAYNPPYVKIASPSVTRLDLLRHVRAIMPNVPAILSTGMSEMHEIHAAVKALGRKNLIILHCTSAYPTNSSEQMLQDLNLDVIWTLQKEFPDVQIGFSSNDPDVEPSVLAVAKGAVVVEKHLTLDRRLHGSDQKSSSEPHAFGEMVSRIGVHHLARGDGIKRITASEVGIREKLLNT